MKKLRGFRLSCKVLCLIVTSTLTRSLPWAHPSPWWCAPHALFILKYPSNYFIFSQLTPFSRAWHLLSLNLQSVSLTSLSINFDRIFFLLAHLKNTRWDQIMVLIFNYFYIIMIINNNSALVVVRRGFLNFDN